MLLKGREAVFNQFIREYETIRRAEGRGSQNANYYQSLPYHILSQQQNADWHIRAASYGAFLKQVLLPMEGGGAPLSILDLGAGNSWLSNCLAKRGHNLAAVDILTNDFDGLGCWRYYESAFTPVQAEFDQLPFKDQGIDLVVFNASLHYSTCYEKTLREALRIINSTGKLVVLDSPYYHADASGQKMVQERESQFTSQYGFPSNALPSENYFTYERLAELSVKLQLNCQIITPAYGIRWAMRPFKARFLRQREPAKFHLVIFTRQ